MVASPMNQRQDQVPHMELVEYIVEGPGTSSVELCMHGVDSSDAAIRKPGTGHCCFVTISGLHFPSVKAHPVFHQLPAYVHLFCGR